MEFEVGYMTALVIVGMGLLLATLAMMIDEVNRRKGIIAGILAAILICLGVYAYAVVAQWQRMKGGASMNGLNHCLRIYRAPAGTVQQDIPISVPSDTQ